MGTHLHPAARLGLRGGSIPAQFLESPPRPRKKRYLQILARALENHHDNGVRFNINCWVEPRYNGMWCREDDFCGTQACAVGLAMGIPELNRKGLGKHPANPHPALYRGPAPAYTKTWFTHMGRQLAEAKYLGKVDPNCSPGFATVCWFFGLSVNEAFWLFSGAAYVGQGRGDEGARDVAARIRHLLRGGMAPTKHRARSDALEMCNVDDPHAFDEDIPEDLPAAISACPEEVEA